jgi:hypothetical protein
MNWEPELNEADGGEPKSVEEKKKYQSSARQDIQKQKAGLQMQG